MIKKIAIGLVAVIAIILGLAATKPDSFQIQRATVIKAPPEKIMPLVTDFHNWAMWSPWEHLDPKMQRTFTGASSGKGSVYAWKGNSDVGQGRMEITEVVAPVKTVIKLDFIEPITSSNVTTFDMVPKDDKTTVTWTMTGPMPYLTKVMNVFASMDSLIGPDLERGLAKMKMTAEIPANEPKAEEKKS